MVRVLVGSGWWCSETPDMETNPNRKKLGDDDIRGVSFFDQWMESLLSNNSVDEIVVVDSSAPIKPDDKKRSKVRWIELPFNARHSTDHTGRWSGWLRSVLTGGSYAVSSEAEYFVYVEQDCLLGGNEIIDHCIKSMKKGFMFGSGEGTPQPIQQSFFIIHRKALPRFLKNLTDIKDRDCEMSPEWKFVLATSRVLVIAANLGLLRHRRVLRLVNRLVRGRSYDVLPVWGGRSRPVRFNSEFFYFQHGTREELEEYTRISCETKAPN